MYDLIIIGAGPAGITAAVYAARKNKGLTYCATCDGPLFKGKDVAIIGGGNSALDAALQLMNIARKV
jgi:thioredoxin reductase